MTTTPTPPMETYRSQKNQRWWYSVVSVVVSILAAGVFVVWYTTYSNQKWCDTLGTLTRSDPHQLPQGSTPLGKQQRQTQIDVYDSLVHQRKQFHCGG